MNAMTVQATAIPATTAQIARFAIWVISWEKIRTAIDVLKIAWFAQMEMTAKYAKKDTDLKIENARKQNLLLIEKKKEKVISISSKHVCVI